MIGNNFINICILNCTECYKEYKVIANFTNLLGRERLNVGVWPVGDGGVRVRDRLECLGVALHDARRQLHLGRLRLYLVGAVDVVVAGEEDQLLLSLSDLPEDEFTIGFPDIFGLFLSFFCNTWGTFRQPFPT